MTSAKILNKNCEQTALESSPPVGALHHVAAMRLVEGCLSLACALEKEEMMKRQYEMQVSQYNVRSFFNALWHPVFLLSRDRVGC